MLCNRYRDCQGPWMVDFRQCCRNFDTFWMNCHVLLKLLVYVCLSLVRCLNLEVALMMWRVTSITDSCSCCSFCTNSLQENTVPHWILNITQRIVERTLLPWSAQWHGQSQHSVGVEMHANQLTYVPCSNQTAHGTPLHCRNSHAVDVLRYSTNNRE